MTILFYTLLIQCFSHGRLIKPIPRFGLDTNNGLDNGPTGDANSDTWVCRHTVDENTQPILDLTAGQPLDLQWDFSAAHVGDCAVYVTYETNTDRAQQKWFKIANMPKCREQNKQDFAITIPEWLPEGRITIRWDWYALHQHPSVEFYSQCIDARVSGSNGQVQLSDIFTYAIPGVYPNNGNDGVGYRYPFGNGDQTMTGPPCALNWNQNNCAETACGTARFIDVKNALSGRRRQLCSDIKQTSECEQAMSGWDMCADSWWNSQCEMTCGSCAPSISSTSSSGTGLPETTSTPGDGDSSLPPGCEAYDYSFESNDSNNGVGGSGTVESSSLNLPIIVAFSLGLAMF